MTHNLYNHFSFYNDILDQFLGYNQVHKYLEIEVFVVFDSTTTMTKAIKIFLKVKFNQL